MNHISADQFIFACNYKYEHLPGKELPIRTTSQTTLHRVNDVISIQHLSYIHHYQTRNIASGKRQNKFSINNIR